ncbi:MAG: hypothetical protein ACTS10_12165 [Kiloniellales bacterium]
MLSLRLAALMALSAALLLVLGPRVAKADISLLEEIGVAGWRGAAAAEDDGLGFCSLGKQYDSGTTLGFVMGEPGLYLILSRPDWRLPIGERYTLTLRVDQSWQQQVTGEVTQDTVLVVSLGRDVEAVRNFKRGRFLEVDARYQSFDFELTGTSRALSLLERCVERLAYAGSADPFGDSTEPLSATNPFTGSADPFRERSNHDPENPFGQETPRALPFSDNWDRPGLRLSPEGLTFVLMALSGSTDVHVHQPEADVGSMQFEVDGVEGTYKEVPNDWRAADAPRVFREFIKALADVCPIEAGHGTLARDLVGQKDFVRGFLACDAPDLYMDVIVWSEPRLAIFLTFGEPRSRQSELEAVSEGIYRMLVHGAMQIERDAGAQLD